MSDIGWRKWLPAGSWRVVGQVDAADEVPDDIPRNGAVLVGSVEHPKWLALDCPCRSGHRIMVSLDSGHWPHWTLVGASTTLTLWPSIDYHGPSRRCHYFIRRGRVHWVRERRWFHGWF